MRRDERFAIDEGTSVRLEIEVPSGSIRIATGDRGVVQVSIDGSDPRDIEVTRLGDVVSVRQPSRWLMRGRSSQVAVWVPVGSDVAVTTASADVELRGALGAVRIRTASGAVDLESAERLQVGTASGLVRIRSCTGAANVTTASGDVEAGRIGGSLAGSHASGDVKVEAVEGSIEVGTASGDVTIRQCLGDDIAIKTISGDVTVGLPSGIRVHPEISTLSGRTTLPSAAPEERSAGAPRRPVRLRLRTVSGDIRVERAR